MSVGNAAKLRTNASPPSATVFATWLSTQHNWWKKVCC